MRPGAATIVAEGEILLLEVGAGGGVDGDEARRIARIGAGAQAAGVVPIDHGAAGIDHVASKLFGNGQRQMPPVNHVVANRVAPAHVPPLRALRIVLVEKMVFALVVDETVGIVHEVRGGREMILGTPRLIISSLGGGKKRRREESKREEAREAGV